MSARLARKQLDRLSVRLANKQLDRVSARLTSRQLDRLSARLPDRQTDRQFRLNFYGTYILKREHKEGIVNII